MTDKLLMQKDGAIGWIIFNQPEKRNAVSQEMWEAMPGYVEGLHASGGRVILCGDMNVARTDADIHPTHNKPGIIGTRPDERALMEEIFSRDMVDVARMLDPDNDRLFTWWPFWRSARERNLGWRIDYIAASGKIARHATDCVIFKDVGGSDHAPVMATFDIAP